MNEHERQVLRAARDKVRIQRDGKSVEITRQEALIYKNHDLAFKGSVHAVRNASEQIAKATAVEAAEIAEQCARWGAVKAQQIKSLARALRSGKVGQRILPHPDDILINQRTGVQIAGPISEEEWPAFERRVKLRDTLYVQHAMEEFDSASPEGGQEPFSTPLVLAMLQNRLLPPSLKLPDDVENWRLSTFRRMSRRQALKACRAAWRTVGKDMPRGRRMVPADVMLPLLGILLDFAQDVTTAGDSQVALDDAINLTSRRLAREVPWPRRNNHNATHLNLGSIRHDAP